MQRQITVRGRGVVARRAGIDTEDAVHRLVEGVMRMPVQRDGAIKFLGARDEALQPSLDAVLVPVSAEYTHAARLQHIFLHAVGKIAVALMTIAFSGYSRAKSRISDEPSPRWMTMPFSRKSGLIFWIFFSRPCESDRTIQLSITSPMQQAPCRGAKRRSSPPPSPRQRTS